MKKTLLVVTLMAGILVAQPVFVQAGGHHAGKKCDGYYKECSGQVEKCKIKKLKKKVKLLWNNKEDLKISDQQMDKIKDIKHAAIKQLIQFKADKEIVMVDLKSQMWQEQIDLDAVNPLIDAKYIAKVKTAKAYVKAISDIQKVLDKDQRAHWKEMIKVAWKDGDCGCFGKSKGCGRKDGAGKKGKLCPITGKVLE